MTNSITDSRELAALIAERGETPAHIGTDDAGNELFRFADQTEVIVTNAGLVTADADGFADLKTGIETVTR